jgi:N-acetylglutamate synthase-like GNAT family acetyltransferase
MSAGDAITVRGVKIRDVPDVERVLIDAYGRHVITSLAARIAAAPREYLVAEIDGSLQGVVAAKHYGRVAYIGMMAVHTVAQRRGLGARLIATLIERLEQSGVATMLLDATEAGVALYERYGFSDLDRTDVYEDEGAPPPEPADARPDVDPAEFRRALALDVRFYGCDRSATLALLAQDAYAFVAGEKDGYVLVRGPVVGPLVAESDASAQRLLARALARRPAASRAFAPRLNPAAGVLFAANGFTLTGSLRHMGRGAPSPPRRARIFSQASLGHG